MVEKMKKQVNKNGSDDEYTPNIYRNQIPFEFR